MASHDDAMAVRLQRQTRLIYSLKVEDMPRPAGLAIMALADFDDVRFALVKANDHWLSEPQDLERSGYVRDPVIQRVEQPADS